MVKTDQLGLWAKRVSNVTEATAVRARSGQIGFMICAKAETEGPPLDPRTPRRPAPEAAISGYPPLRCASHDLANGGGCSIFSLDGPQQSYVTLEGVVQCMHGGVLHTAVEVSRSDLFSAFCFLCTCLHTSAM